MGQRQTAEWCTTGDIQTKFAKQLIRLSMDTFAVNQFEKTASGWFTTKVNVGGDVEIIEDAQLLVNEFDAKCAGFARRSNFNVRSIDANLTGVAGNCTAEDLHQR